MIKFDMKRLKIVLGCKNINRETYKDAGGKIIGHICDGEITNLFSDLHKVLHDDERTFRDEFFAAQEHEHDATLFQFRRDVVTSFDFLVEFSKDLNAEPWSESRRMQRWTKNNKSATPKAKKSRRFRRVKVESVDTKHIFGRTFVSKI
jgi:hypothetical protein